MVRHGERSSGLWDDLAGWGGEGRRYNTHTADHTVAQQKQLTCKAAMLQLKIK